MKRFFSSDHGWDGLLLRLGLGIMMFPHGAQKMLGWFGGNGFSGTMGYFTENMGIPAIFAFAAIVTEFFGAIALLVGAGTRLAALGIGFTMVVAAYFHLDNGFFMNWSGNQAGEGIEFHILAVAMSAALVIRGSGALAVDHFLAQKIKDA